MQKIFISKNALDEATAQRDALKSQLATAEARAGLSRNNVDKTRVVAPFAGTIEEQMVAAGDYVKLGDPLFRLVSNARLRAHLPFPESAAPRLKVGMPVRITSPLAPEAGIEGVVEDIRPTVGEGNRAIDVIARLDNPGALKAGGSVDAAVVTGQKDERRRGAGTGGRAAPGRQGRLSDRRRQGHAAVSSRSAASSAA